MTAHPVAVQVRLKDELGAISYGRAEVAGESQGDLSASQRERLMDTLSLLAYDDPAASPHGSLMAEQARRDLAEAVDKAVLQHLGHLQHSNLEHLLRSLVRKWCLCKACGRLGLRCCGGAGGAGGGAEEQQEHCGRAGRL